MAFRVYLLIVSVIRRKLQICVKEAMRIIWVILISSLICRLVQDSLWSSWERLLLRRRRLESHHPSEPVVSSLFFFSLINVDPTDVGDRDCRMLKKDYPSYACFFQCQYYNKEASKLILEPTKDPFGFLIFTYCTSDELDLGSVQIASNRHPKRAQHG